MCRRPAGDSVAGGSEAAARAPAEQLHRVGARDHLRPARAHAGQASQTRRGAPTPPRPSLYEVRIPYNHTLWAAVLSARYIRYTALYPPEHTESSPPSDYSGYNRLDILPPLLIDFLI